MAITPYIRTNPKNSEAAEVDISVARCWESIIKNPLLQNISIISNVVLTISDLTVAHGLGKNIKGWIVIRQNANAVIYESLTANTSSSATIILKASATVTVSILFF